MMREDRIGNSPAGSAVHPVRLQYDSRDGRGHFRRGRIHHQNGRRALMVGRSDEPDSPHLFEIESDGQDRIAGESDPQFSAIDSWPESGRPAVHAIPSLRRDCRCARHRLIVAASEALRIFLNPAPAVAA